MSNIKLLAALCAFSCLSNVALAARPDSIFGRWIEKLPNGNGIITEFAANTISSYKVDASGKQTSAATPVSVTYRDLGKTIGVDFEGGGEVVVLPKTPNSILLNFPGQGSHQLVRQRSQQ